MLCAFRCYRQHQLSQWRCCSNTFRLVWMATRTKGTKFRTVSVGQKVRTSRQRARQIRMRKKYADILKFMAKNLEVIAVLQQTLEGLGCTISRRRLWRSRPTTERRRASTRTWRSPATRSPLQLRRATARASAQPAAAQAAPTTSTSRIRSGCAVKDANPNSWVSHGYMTFQNSPVPFWTDLTGSATALRAITARLNQSGESHGTLIRSKVG